MGGKKDKEKSMMGTKRGESYVTVTLDDRKDSVPSVPLFLFNCLAVICKVSGIVHFLLNPLYICKETLLSQVI